LLGFPGAFRLNATVPLKRGCSARLTVAGHAFVRTIRRGHDELAVDEPAGRRLAVAFDELAVASYPSAAADPVVHPVRPAPTSGDSALSLANGSAGLSGYGTVPPASLQWYDRALRHPEAGRSTGGDLSSRRSGTQ
jgi:hypothetical protein